MLQSGQTRDGAIDFIPKTLYTPGTEIEHRKYYQTAIPLRG